MPGTTVAPVCVQIRLSVWFGPQFGIRTSTIRERGFQGFHFTAEPSHTEVLQRHAALHGPEVLTPSDSDAPRAAFVSSP